MVDSEGPFGYNIRDANVAVGFGDTALLIVSLVGFAMLASIIYSLILLRVQSREDFDKAEEEKLDYDEKLEKADVATLTRAQRRARARNIMKRERRITPLHNHHDDPDNNGDGAQLVHQQEPEEEEPVHHHHLSRKERQRAAKAAEREERKLFEDKRRQQQRNAQETAQRERKERERQEVERLEEERRLRREQNGTQERAKLLEWNTFLVSRDGDDVMTVKDFAEYAQQQKVVSIDALATRFRRPSEQVIERIEKLVESCRLTGVVDGDRFVYVTNDEMKAVVEIFSTQKQMSLQDVVKAASSVVQFQA